MTEIEQIMKILEGLQQMIDNVEDGIDKCLDRIEAIENTLEENHIGE